MNAKQQQMCNWSGLIFVVVYAIGFWPLAGFFPPMTPTMTPSEVASFYQHDTNIIRLGMVLTLAACGFIMPFFALISDLMKRIPGCGTSLVYSQLGSGACTTSLLLLPPMLFTVTAFRPDRDMNITFLLNDLSWIVMIIPFCTATIQLLVTAIAILSDGRTEPTFPRWAGYMNAWVGILLIPGGAMTFFKTGPFAWSGLFCYYIPFGVYFVWIVIMFFLMQKAIKRQQ